MDTRKAIDAAARLGELGFVVRSAELQAEAQRIRDFNERGGNRQMRRARKRVRSSR